MAKKQLETELRAGAASFSVYGKAKISADTFPDEETKSNSGWVYKRASFPVRTDSGNSVYVQLMGGHSSDSPVVYAFNKDNELLRIKWDLRGNEEVLSNVAERSFIRVRLEKDSKGNLIERKFISELDAIEYISGHLKNDDEVYVGGQIEYQKYNGEIQRNFNITMIARAEDHAQLAQIKQTYLLDSNALDRGWEDKLKKDGKIFVHGFVPQYVGKPQRKTLAFPQTFVYKSAPEDVEKRIKIAKKFFVVDKTVVREITLRNELLYGPEVATGQVELTDELQELIDLGLMTKEQVEQEAVITGRRVDETVFSRIMTTRNNEGKQTISMSDRYAPEALVVEQEDEHESSKLFEEESSEESEDDIFDTEELFA